MTLEELWKDPTTLARFQSGPLGVFLEGFYDWLLNQGFSRSSVRRRLRNLSHLNEYLRRRKRPWPATVSTDDVHDFFQARQSRSRHSRGQNGYGCWVRRSVNRFIKYLKQQGRFRDLTPQPIYAPLRDAYLDWMARHQHALPGTLEVRAENVTQFLKWLGPRATPDGLRNLNGDEVEQFSLADAKRKGPAGRRSMNSALRTFFRFCLHQGHVLRPLDRAVPTLRTYKLATVPRGVSEEHAEQILRGIDRTTSVGRRDYAILQLLSSYGVRGRQVQALRLEDIDWVHDEILFRAAKRGKDVRLPLLPEVGESLLDYLQHARPSCPCPEIFLTCRAPYHPLLKRGNLSNLVGNRVQAASDLPRVGTHAFRHGFATRMLHRGQSLKAIADVLGHVRLDTTFIYTKVDYSALKQVALEWPQEVAQ